PKFHVHFAMAVLFASEESVNVIVLPIHAGSLKPNRETGIAAMSTFLVAVSEIQPISFTKENFTGYDPPPL
ncbi:hypothetical protein NP569_27405, partial [Vibrio parahaemolyticus]|nr:hypothetical protein [Vibrio parahaemolyticus]